MLVVFLILSKYRKKATLDGFISSCFLYLKTGIGVLYGYLGYQYAVWYGVVCLLFFLLLRPPKYDGPDNCIHLNPDAFTRRIKKSTDKQTRWIIFFHADWCDTSVQHEAMFAELSLKYANDDIKFAKMDLGRYPEIADDFKIDISSTASWQLPSILCFQNRQETHRLPPFDANGNVIKTILDMKGVAKVMQL